VNFNTIKVEELKKIEYKFEFVINKVGIINGVGFWFDAEFNGSNNKYILSTSPAKP